MSTVKAVISCFLLSVLLCLTPAGCGGNREAEQQFSAADAVMNQRPDSALNILESVNLASLGRGERARYGLLVAKASDKNYILPDNDSLIAEAAAYYYGRGDSLEVQALYYHGYHYSTNEKPDSALLVLNTAYEKALEIHDYFYAAMSAREMSAVFRRVFMMEESYDWATEAQKLFADAGRPVHAAWMNHDIADNLIFTGKFEEASRMLDSIAANSLYTDVMYRRRTLLNGVELALQLGDYNKALALYDSLSLDGYAPTAHDRLNQVKASLGLDKVDNAAGYLVAARELPLSEADSLYLGKMSSRVAASRGNYREAYSIDSIFADGLMQSDIKRLTNPQTRLLHDNYVLRDENHKIREGKTRLLIALLVVGSIMLVALIILVYRYYSSVLACKRLEAERLMAEAQTLRDDLTLSRNRNTAMAETNGTLLNTISDMESDYATQVRKLFSRHADMLNGVCEIWFKNREAALSAKGNRILYGKISDMVERLHSLNVVDELVEIIDRHNDGWATRLRNDFPNLTDTDYALAIYIFLGFRTETIMMLTGRESAQTVYAARHRLKRKLLEQGSRKEVTDLIVLLNL